MLFRLSHRLFCVLAIASGMAACTAAPASGDPKAALASADSAFQAAVTARDLEQTLSFYTSDAVLMPAAKPIIVGRDSIRAEWRSLYAIPGFSNAAKLLAVDASAANDLAYTRGSYETQLMGEDRRLLTERGKWVSVWRRQPDGSWKITVDIYNTDTKPPDHL